MRVLSIVHWHHFAYMIISLALLGYGTSGTFIAVFRKVLEPRFEIAFATSAALFSVAMLACYVLGQAVPFNAMELIWDARQLLYLSLVYLIFFIPFFFAACCIGLVFTCRPDSGSRIYLFDLLGAGLGAIVVIGAMFVLFPQQALLILVSLAVAASLLAGAATTAKRLLLAVPLLWLVSVLFLVPDQWLGLRLSEFKGLNQAMQIVDARAVAARSSPLGLVTVVESPAVPFRHAPGLSISARAVPPEQLAVFTDGDSMSVINRYDGDLGELDYLADVTAALPYQLAELPAVLVLGAGGGTDVLLALYHGAESVDAVELNPQVTEFVAKTYADFAGHLYADPRVRVHTREARGFVARSNVSYDLIHIGLLDSFGASGAGVQALNESYLYTVEGIREYLARLQPEGMLAITRWLKVPPRDSLKLFATCIAALREAGVAQPGLRLAMIRGWNTSTLLVKNGDFSQAEVAAISEFARTRSFDTVFYPGMEAAAANRFNRLQEPYLFDGALALLGDAAASYVDAYKFDIEPATDNKPYFFQFFKWQSLREVLELRQRGGAGLIEWGYLILVATLLQAAVAAAALILLPLAVAERSWPKGTGLRMGSYFLLLGIAFLFIEIAFIQKFILFLSHPLYSVAVVLAAFLVFAGLGSGASYRFTVRAPVALAVVAIAAIALLYLLLLPFVFQQFMGLADGIKVAVAVVLIAPLAFFMGMPFPLGLRLLAQEAAGFIPWAWGINGFASVVSAVLATLLAIEFGFTAVLALALVIYALAAVLIRGGQQRMDTGIRNET